MKITSTLGLVLALSSASALADSHGTFDSVYPTFRDVSSSFSGEAAQKFYEILEKGYAPVKSRYGVCSQITANGIACSKWENDQQIVSYRCVLVVDSKGVLSLANPVLCPITGGIGVSN